MTNVSRKVGKIPGRTTSTRQKLYGTKKDEDDHDASGGLDAYDMIIIIMSKYEYDDHQWL